MKGGNKYADTLHTCITGTDPVCNLIDCVWIGSIVAGNGCISDHDIWRHHDNQKHFQTRLK